MLRRIKGINDEIAENKKVLQDFGSRKFIDQRSIYVGTGPWPIESCE